MTSVSVIGGDAGTSSRARLALTGEGVPDSVFVKMPAETAATRVMGELGRLAETETRFYRELSPQLSGLPKSYGSAFDPLTGRFVLVLEDLAVDRCEFPDTLHPLSADQASQVVELLARLHATFWERLPAWAVHGVGRHRGAPDGPAVEDFGAPDRREDGHPRRNGPLHRRELPRGGPADRRAAATPSCTATPIRETSTSATARRACWTGRRCGAGTPAGNWPTPLSRAWTPTTGGTTNANCSTTTGRCWRPQGDPRLDRDELWDRYRAGALYAYVAPLITAGMGGMQAEGIAMEGLRRGVAALDDLDTVALLQKSL